MMVFFNDPIPCDDPARRAVALALGMLVSERIITMLQGAVRADHFGDVELKGIARPVPTFVVQRLVD